MSIGRLQPGGGVVERLLARPFALAVLLFARAITAVRGLWPESGPWRRQAVYFANHSSHGDFILIWAVQPPRQRRRLRPVAGADYWRRSRLTTFIGRDVFNAVLIERDAGTRTTDPVAQMVEALDEGSSLILFPEGTRNLTEDILLPFKTGLYHLAGRRPGVDLVPVWIANLNRVLPKGEIIPIPLICTVTFGEPLRLKENEARDDFLDRARQALLALAPKPQERGA
ncbi:1-acyl-sn-glycerol-3-phosphate acyltransferase [bacterium YEK0313]|nr:1-acyl-sn-glycerol-3-phosphate acyltransferase [bacterium YEK0313]